MISCNGENLDLKIIINQNKHYTWKNKIHCQGFLIFCIGNSFTLGVLGQSCERQVGNFKLLKFIVICVLLRNA